MIPGPDRTALPTTETSGNYPDFNTSTNTLLTAGKPTENSNNAQPGADWPENQSENTPANRALALIQRAKAQAEAKEKTQEKAETNTKSAANNQNPVPRRTRYTHGQSGPAQASTAAAEQLSPSYPFKAARGTAGSLRQWQSEALEKYLASHPQDFLAVATPGAGKTTFALRIAVELMGQGIVQKVTVVCPTQHLKNQWAMAAAKVGIHIDPSFTNSQGRAGAHFDGIATTYAQVAMNPLVHRRRTEAQKTLVIFDEIHHAGHALSWGEGTLQAFAGATRRLCLTGTPFRSDTTPIPFVRYEVDPSAPLKNAAGAVMRSQADYSYSYGPALKDGVVRPVIFLSYTGTVHWQSHQGDEVLARLGEPLNKQLEKQAWRTALDPEGEWIAQVLAAADQRLTKTRRQVPDAGGLVIATNQEHARYYGRLLAKITGEEPTVVLSDEDDSSDLIDEFSQSDRRWMVAVRMVSEGVDVPRLCVGVYATSACTPLYFAQAVGRFVRSRRRGEVASIFLPSVRPLLELAAQLEAERDHALEKTVNPGGPVLLDPYGNVIGGGVNGSGLEVEVATNQEYEPGLSPEELEFARAQNAQSASNALNGFQAIDSEAEFNGVLFDGAEYGVSAEVGSIEEQEFLGIPGLLDPEQVSQVLYQRQLKQLRQQRKAMAAAKKREANAQIPDHKRRAQLRRELSKLVAHWARQSGQSHAAIHNRLRHSCGGGPVAQATTDQLQQRVDLIRKWFVGL